jgi:hypothetical protein
MGTGSCGKRARHSTKKKQYKKALCTKRRPKDIDQIQVCVCVCVCVRVRVWSLVGLGTVGRFVSIGGSICLSGRLVGGWMDGWMGGWITPPHRYPLALLRHCA